MIEELNWKRGSFAVVDTGGAARQHQPGRAMFQDAKKKVFVGNKGAGKLKVDDKSASPAQYARQFYSTLRKLDEKHVKQIWIELPPDLPQWLGIRDRVMRATRAFCATR